MTLKEYKPGTAFSGVVGRTFDTAEQAWPEPKRAKEGAPNVLFVVLDDVGFGQIGCYGSPIKTPNDEDDWLGYVPIRLPETISLQKRLPPGAATVLINQSHTDPDLILPVSATEVRLVEAINGKRTVAEIIQNRTASGHSSRQLREQARSLFERLWWYD